MMEIDRRPADRPTDRSWCRPVSIEVGNVLTVLPLLYGLQLQVISLKCICEGISAAHDVVRD